MNFVDTSKVPLDQGSGGLHLSSWAVLHHLRNTRRRNNRSNMDRSYLHSKGPWPYVALFGSIRWLVCHLGKHLRLEQAQ